MRQIPRLNFFFTRRYFSPTNALFSSPNQSSSPQQWLPSIPNKVSFKTTLPLDTNHVCNDHLHYMNTFSSLVKQLCKNPRNFVALNDLDSMLRDTHLLDSATSVYVIEGLCKIKKLQRAKSVLLNLRKNVKVSSYFLYSLVIDCMVSDGRIGDVEIFWSEICEFDIESRRINVSDYVVYLCKFEDLWEIKKVFERVLMGDWVLTEQSYMALIEAFCGKDEGFLAKMVLLEMNDKGFEADDISYVVMFQCFCRNGELEEADFVLRRLIRRGYKMDICIYGSFLYGLCKSGKIREATKLFEKLIKNDSHRSTEPESLKKGRRAIFQLSCESVVPEIMAYETYFRSLCSTGRLDEAEMLLKKMMKKRTLPQICVYGCFIKALFNAGREEDAMKFLNAERKKGLQPIDEITRFIISGLCSTGKVDDALTVFDDIVSKGGVVSVMGVYDDILGCFWKQRRVYEAERLFERIRSGTFGPPSVSSFTTMVTGFCRRGDVMKALHIFEEMRSANMKVNWKLYEMIIRLLCDYGKVKEAYTHLNYMIENGYLVSYNRWRSLFSHGDRHRTLLRIEAQ